MQNSVCLVCGQPFELDQADFEFYQKIQVPVPKLCPKDRLRRRLAFRNERTLYKRMCDKTGQSIISNMRPDAKVPVYATEEWHKDDWTAPFLPTFDFSRSFFDQFQQLSGLAPRMHKATAGNDENSEYTNYSGNCKNCYFIFNSEYVEDGLYLRFADHCRDCADCTNILKSELCYECVNVENCYNVRFSDDCQNCRDSFFLRNCRSVENSIFCYGLEHKQYYVFNQPFTPDEYPKKLAEMKLDTYSGLQKAIQTWEQWSAQFPKTRMIMVNCDKSSGNSLYNSKNSRDCYNCSDIEDSRYVLNAVRVKDSYDLYAYGLTELGYEFVTAFNAYNVKFSAYVVNSDNMEYCETCYNCHYCFGCVGLNGKSYSIFNKPYGKQEYEDLVMRIRQKMIQDSQYGEFFPVEFSPFPYEDTLANDYFPEKNKQASLAQDKYDEVFSIPEDISMIEHRTFLCPETGKLFRFQKKELEFYKKMSLPIPRLSFEARYQRRNKLIPFPY